MHGFLNVFIAAVLAQRHASCEDLCELLESRDRHEFHFETIQYTGAITLSPQIKCAMLAGTSLSLSAPVLSKNRLWICVN